LQLQSFLDTNTDALGATAIANLNRALATLDGSIQWNDKHKPAIVAYLTEKMGSSSASMNLFTSLLMVLPVLLVKFL
jgi:hypothetical protein